jgi:hypothetical protein
MGFIFSPFLVNTPHCKALLWGINNSVINIQNMWLLIGYWFMNRINPLHENVKKD